MVRQFETIFDTVSVVVLFEPKDRTRFGIDLDQKAIEELEDALDGTLRVTQGVDGLLAISIPRHNLELTVAINRIEVRSLNPEFSDAVGERMIRLLRSIFEKLEISSLRSIGHNFVITLSKEKGSSAKLIESRLIKTGLGKKTHYEVLGAAASLWLKVEESTLLLKFEPHRNSMTSNRYSANANFSVDFSDETELPDANVTVDLMVKYCRRLQTILKDLGI